MNIGLLKRLKEKKDGFFHLSEGQNYLDGKTALYYVRSRYSTNDFDRMRRQQEVLMSIKKKVFL